MEINFNLVGMHLNTLRQQKNLTVEALSELIEIPVTPQHLSQVLLGKAPLSLKLLVNLCNALGTTRNDILVEHINNKIDVETHLHKDIQRVYSDCTSTEVRHMLSVSSAIKQSLRISNTP